MMMCGAIQVLERALECGIGNYSAAPRDSIVKRYSVKVTETMRPAGCSRQVKVSLMAGGGNLIKHSYGVLAQGPLAQCVRPVTAIEYSGMELRYLEPIRFMGMM